MLFRSASLNTKVVGFENASFFFYRLAEFAESSLRSISTPSYVSDQPIGLEEMLEGARNRAMGAHASAEGCLFGK